VVLAVASTVLAVLVFSSIAINIKRFSRQKPIVRVLLAVVSVSLTGFAAYMWAGLAT